MGIWSAGSIPAAQRDEVAEGGEWQAKPGSSLPGIDAAVAGGEGGACP
jgi:hypothetical protein